MLGAIIGDIIGSRFEFNPTNDYNFELFSEECSFTDATICTVAVADALLKGKDYGESIHEWCRKYPNPMGGYGSLFRKWIMSNDPKPYNSFDNGSAMRVSPIGWWCTAQELLKESKKSAACTHNHELGMEGALAVAIAIYDCYEWRVLSKGKPITKNVIENCLDHAKQLYFGPGDIELDIEKYRNKFDETCQGTVPVALWIVLHSQNYEDAVRRAVSLGVDADTLGTITGSIAEALWGIPEWMKEKAMSYLTQEMKDVVNEFHRRLDCLRKLTKRCTYYKVGEFNYVEENGQQACSIEKHWAQDLSKSYENVDKVKTEIGQWMPLNRWQALADEYDLPLSLLGYLYVQTKCKGKFSKAKMKAFEKFLDANYKHVNGDKREALNHKIQAKIMMFWKLGLNHSNQMIGDESPIPSNVQQSHKKLKQKLKAAQCPNAEFSELPLDLVVSESEMEILRKGHFPVAMEDHWLMYADKNHIRYYRSWTSQLAFDAHYHKKGDGYCIDMVRINHNLLEFGVNGDIPGAMLFIYLITAEVGGNAYDAWEKYLDAWEIQNKKNVRIFETQQKAFQHMVSHVPTIKEIKEGSEFLFFWGHHAKQGMVTKACLSQWWPCTFYADGQKYNCAEQYMMAEKARLMNDEETRGLILSSSDPKEMKALGRRVKNFDEKKWNEHKWEVVLNGNRYKFQQNPALRDFLLSTSDKVLAEASPYDTIWGIGLAEDAPESKNPAKWRGENLLGFALMQVREYIKEFK